MRVFTVIKWLALTSRLIGKESLSKDVFKRSTGNGRFVSLGSDFAQIFGQIVSRRHSAIQIW